MSAPPSSHSAPQRRHVTVLFLDVVGSTELTGRLDPEDVSEVMDGALERFSAVVLRHGGRVLQYAGDSLLAAFGADRSREDDAERAVHTGLALLAAAKEHAALVKREYGFDGFDVRVGMHTGHVILGGGVDADGTIRGLTVNIAARMEQSAPPGTVRISHDTWRHVRGAFEAQVQAPLQVKGHEKPLVTYLVARAHPRALRAPGRGIEGIETGFVGREAELARLLDAWRRSAAGGGLQAATVLADAGLGKSRLLHELYRRLDAGQPRPVYILRGRSQPSGQQQAYGLLRDLLARELQIADSDSAETARTQLVEGLRPHFAADGDEAALRQAELLGQLVGMDFTASPRLAASLQDARLLRDGALAAFATWLQRLAAHGGTALVLALDDLQWTDDASLDMLEQLVRRTELPLFLLLAARPVLRERRPEWGAGWERHESIVLAPLDPAGRRVLMRALLQRLDDVPAELETLVEGQAEGNPYYAEELVQMLIDVGVIDTAGERWSVRRESADVMARLQAHQMAGDDFSLAAEACARSGQPAEARALLELAIDAYRKVELAPDMCDCRVLLADAWRAEGELPRALALLEPEMAAPAPGAAVEQTGDLSMSARMAAWRILAAANDPRAARQLELAWEELQRSVSRVRDPALKERMLAAGPLQREIAAAWAVRAPESARAAR